jgi:uncharacterized membrane protein
MICMLMHLLRHRQAAASPHDQNPPRRPLETAGEILDRRYAGGEITREQYDELKRTLDITRGTS